MTKNIISDYTALDHPNVLQFIFHPRPEPGSGKSSKNIKNLQIPVEGPVSIGAKLHHSGHSAPTILFFHGNGEIVSDYDDLGPFYTQLGINFLPVDYRGYGKSGGSPTVTNMMKDAHVIFKFVKEYLAVEKYQSPLLIMGRSLGSASALELAKTYENEIDGLIIESGFAYAIPLLTLLGVDTGSLGLSEENGFDNYRKIKSINIPTLIIHAEFDHIIPFSDGQALFAASPSREKFFLKIPDANHNTIISIGLKSYMEEIKRLVDTL